MIIIKDIMPLNKEKEMNAKNEKDPLEPPSTKTEKSAKGEKKEKTEKKEVTPKKSKFQLLYPDSSKIKLLVEENPKKEGSKAREKFAHYFTTTNVGDFIAAGGTYSTIAYDVGRKFIEVTDVPEAALAAKAG